MTRKKVIAFKNMPSRIPFWCLFIVWLMLDRLKPAGWIVGAVWTIVVVMAIADVISFFTQIEVDVLEEKEGKL